MEKTGKPTVFRARPPLDKGGYEICLLAPYDPGLAATDIKIEKHGFPQGFSATFNMEVDVPGSETKVRGCYDIDQDPRLQGRPAAGLREIVQTKLMESRFRGIDFEVYDAGTEPVTISAEELVALRELRSQLTPAGK